MRLLARGPEQLLRLAGTLADAFYLLAFVALVAALTAGPGLGLLFLLAAGALHAARVALEESVRASEEPQAEGPQAGEPEIKLYDARPKRRRAAGSPARARSRSAAGTRR